MIGAGVLGGAAIAFQVSEMKSLSPSSIMVGTSGSEAMRFFGGDGENARPAALVQLQRSFELHEDQIDVAGDDVVERRAGALVGHVLKLRAGQLVEQLRRQMRRGGLGLARRSSAWPGLAFT